MLFWLFVYDTKDWLFPTHNFNLEVDVTTALTIAALSAGIIDKDDLVYATDEFYQFPNDDTVTSVSFDNRTLMYDPKYPDMSPIYYVRERVRVCVHVCMYAYINIYIDTYIFCVFALYVTFICLFIFIICI
jgi:hypothetical protein